MRPRLLLGVLAAGLIAVPAMAAPVNGQEGATFAREVNMAVDRGIAYLSKLQKEDGTWDIAQKGAIPLLGWALLEAGVAPNDDRVRKVAEFTRKHVFVSDQTYDLALAIFFLDKLGDPRDIPLVEMLALQLMIGQDPRSGGWGYRCQGLPLDEQKRVQAYLAKVKWGPIALPQVPIVRNLKEVSPTIRDLALKLYRTPFEEYKLDKYDNSNTQFAMLALWVARRYGMPVDRALLATEIRFRATQQKSGGWSYYSRPFDPKGGAQANAATPQMTASGLISLALGNACKVLNNLKFTSLARDDRVKTALYVLAASIGEPGQKREDLKGGITGRGFYSLWTLERMALIYDFKTIGGKDWYRWGAELLLANQHQDGSWSGDYGLDGIDTCFALLFLKRANPARDLKEVAGKVNEPGKVPKELLEMIGREVESRDFPKIKKDQPKKNSPQQESSSAVRH